MKKRHNKKGIVCRECETGFLQTKSVVVVNKDGSSVSKKIIKCSICDYEECVDDGHRRAGKEDGYKQRREALAGDKERHRKSHDKRYEKNDG